MVKPNRCIAIAATLALLSVAPVASAQDGILLEASSATLGLGSSATLEPLFFTTEQGIGSNATTPAGFELEAALLRVEVDHAASARTQVSEPFVPENTTHTEYVSATVAGQENRVGFRFMVIPGHDSHLRVQTACATLEPAHEKQIQRPPRANSPSDRAPIDVDVSSSMQWNGCGPTRLTFTGNYTLALWEWDFEVRDDAETTRYSTGHFQNEALPKAPNGAASVGNRREAWLFVQDGHLEIQLTQNSPHFLYAGASVRMDTESGLLFQDAKVLEASSRLKDKAGEIYFTGSLLAALEVDASRITARISGDVTGITVDQDPLALPASTTTTSPIWMPPKETLWLLPLGPLALLGWLWWQPVRIHGEEQRRGHYTCNPRAETLLQRRASGKVIRARRHLELAQPRRALIQVRRSKPAHPTHAEAIIIRAEAMLQCARKGGRNQEQLLDKARDLLDSVNQSCVGEQTLARYFCALGDLCWQAGYSQKAGDMILAGGLYGLDYTRKFVDRLPYKDSLLQVFPSQELPVHDVT